MIFEQIEVKWATKKIGVFNRAIIPILAETPVEITFRQAIEVELTNRGFRVTEEQTNTQVTVNLNRFYNEFNEYSGLAVAELQMLVTVKSNSGTQTYTKQIVAQGFDQVARLTAENAIQPLSKALRNGVEILFGDPDFVPGLLSSTLK